jgi:hypothetical protein
VPLYCNTTLNSFFTWDTGQPPTPMGRADHRVCFLTGMRGAFQDPADEIHATLDAATQNWFLTGKTGSGADPVHAQARCVDVASYSAEQTWTQGDPPLRLAAASNSRACFLTRIAGHFEGAGEQVQVVDIAQGIGSITLTGFSGEAGVSASARCVDELRMAGFNQNWSQGNPTIQLELVSQFPACFLQGITGRFEGAGEQVNISAAIAPDGLRWVIGGSSQQQGVEGFVQCMAP